MHKDGRGNLGNRRNLNVSEIEHNKKMFDSENAFMKTFSMHNGQLLPELPEPSIQVTKLLRLMALNLRTGGIPINVVEADLGLIFPLGLLENSKSLRLAIQMCGRPQVTTSEVFMLSSHLEHCAQVSRGMNPKKQAMKLHDGSNLKCMYWIDLILSIYLFGSSNPSNLHR